MNGVIAWVKYPLRLPDALDPATLRPHRPLIWATCQIQGDPERRVEARTGKERVVERRKRYAAVGLAVGLAVGTVTTAAAASSPFTQVVVESVKGMVMVTDGDGPLTVDGEVGVDGTVLTAPAPADIRNAVNVSGNCAVGGRNSFSREYVIRAVSAGDSDPSDGSTVKVSLYRGESLQPVAVFFIAEGDTVQPSWELVADAMEVEGSRGCSVHLMVYDFE